MLVAFFAVWCHRVNKAFIEELLLAISPLPALRGGENANQVTINQAMALNSQKSN
jgi:hypothetical protein